MQSAHKNKEYLELTEISRLLVVSQLAGNTLYGMTLTLILSLYLGFSLQTVFYSMLLYFFMAIIVYVPFYYFFPFIFFRGLSKEVAQNIKSPIKIKQASKTIARLLKLPINSSIYLFFTSYLGFLAAIALIWLGVIPEFASKLLFITMVVLTLGLIVGVMQAFLAYYLMHKYINSQIGKIIIDFPILDIASISRKTREPLSEKILFLVLLPAFSVEVSILLVVLSKVYITAPQALFITTLLLSLIVITSTIFLWIIAKRFTGYLTKAFDDISLWAQKVSAGDMKAKLNVVTNDELDDVVSYMRDMVAQITRQQIIATGERDKFDTVLSNINDGVVALDDTYRILFMNKAAEQMLETSTELVVRMKFAKALRVKSKEGELVNDRDLIALLTSGGDISDDKAIFNVRVGKNGTKYFRFKVVDLPPENDEISYIITMYDVTREEELERMKLDFVSIAAHELRTPITSIRGYLMLLNDELGEKLNAEQKEFLERVMISSEELTSLIDNILNIARIEKDALKLQLVSLDINELVTKEIDRQMPLAKEKQIEVEFHTSKEPIPKASADRFWISQVVMNLINNAIKYTQPGGKVIVTTGKVDDEFISVSVIDNGPGIPSDALPHMFEKFFRVSGSLEQGSKGTGLGLYISKAIIEEHGGTIEVDSREGHGTTFRFTLPISKV